MYIKTSKEFIIIRVGEGYCLMMCKNIILIITFFSTVTNLNYL